jgi:uncharacterized protein (DUF2062 family)
MDAPPPVPAAAEPVRARLARRLGLLVRGNHPPERVAVSLALGATLGLFPVFGTTTLLCVAVGVAFRLNHAALQLANQLMYPVQIPLLFVFMHAGARLMGAPPPGTPLPPSWTDAAAVLEVLGRAGAQAVAGWAVCAPFVTAGLYFACLPVLRRLARKEPAVADA